MCVTCEKAPKHTQNLQSVENIQKHVRLFFGNIFFVFLLFVTGPEAFLVAPDAFLVAPDAFLVAPPSISKSITNPNMSFKITTHVLGRVLSFFI